MGTHTHTMMNEQHMQSFVVAKKFLYVFPKKNRF